MSKITVVLVNEHKLMREMFAELFCDNEVEVVGESSRFGDVVELIKTKRPDIVLMPINQPPFFGLDKIPLIKEFSPATKIIGISEDSQPAYVEKMLQSGGKGYITKNFSGPEIYIAIQNVMNDNIYVSGRINSGPQVYLP